MPRFYFHILDGRSHDVDLDGTEFPSLECAVADARDAAREYLSEKMMAGNLIGDERFEIADENGNVVKIIVFKTARL